MCAMFMKKVSRRGSWMTMMVPPVVVARAVGFAAMLFGITGITPMGAVPVAAASASISAGRASRNRGTQCLDDPSYMTKLGTSCETIRRGNLKCDGFFDAGFTQKEVDELNAACPSACGRCCGFEGGCADDPTYVGRLDLSCEVIRRKSFACWRFSVLGYVSEKMVGRRMCDVRRGPPSNAYFSI
jgi:hypothetical protein